jgi:hypothetical protein
MPEAILSDYFYGDESEQFVFFKLGRERSSKKISAMTSFVRNFPTTMWKAF